MEIDLSQFHQTFFEEASEHLANLENLLLNLDAAAPDDEDLNAIFRAVHSIKGSGATFGFADLSESAHIFENLLDQLRQHHLALTPEILDLCLQARDMLSGFLAVYRDGAKKDEAQIANICERLKKAASGESAEKSAKIHGEPPKILKKNSGLPWKNVFLVEFKVLDSAKKGLNNLFEELSKLGEIENQTPFDSKTQTFKIKTNAKQNEIAEWLDFVCENHSLKIAPENLTDDANGAYGFFNESETDTEKSSKPIDDENGAYGFFEPIEEQAKPAEIKKPPKPSKPPIDKKSTDLSIRVPTAKVDQLINLVGELVMAKSMLLAVLGEESQENELLFTALNNLERNSRDLQEAVMGIRMLPLSFVFSRFPRLVHDLSAQLGKKARLEIQGESTEIDKGMIEKISDPLTHLIRNALDHGIEMPNERIQAEKNEEGVIRLSARHQGGNVVIEIGDDGAGLNKAKILAKARERGMPLKENMTDHDIFALICEAGFSTAQKVTDVSGRGVGMDVVKKNLQILGGRLEIDSIEGIGTKMSIFLPLTLAILDGMSVKIGKQTYILPLSCVEESFQIHPKDLKTMSHQWLVKVRGDYLPIIIPHILFQMAPDVAKEKSWQEVLCSGIVVVLISGHRRAAFFVDALLGQHQVVIKSIETNYHAIKGFSGATILGNGQVALIFDPHALVDSIENEQKRS